MRRNPRVDRVLVAGVVVVVLAAAFLRCVHLFGGLPRVVAPDEPTVMDRAVSIARGHGGPHLFDWPPLSMYLLAGLMKVAGRIGDYRFARLVFAAVALVLVALAGALGGELADTTTVDRRARRVVAWSTAALVGTSYLLVRLGRLVHPDELQLCLVVGSFLCTMRFDRRRDQRWLVGAGLLAGFAAATKYLGGLIVIPALAATVFPTFRRLRLEWKPLALLAGSAAAAFVVGVPQIVTRFADVRSGLAFQFGHQAGGHLGYDGLDRGWVFHLVHSLPGNWGVPITVLALVGLVWTVVSGTRAQRLAALFVVPTFAIVGASRVRFPHYVVLVVPFLAAAAAVTTVRLVGLLRRTPVLALVVLLAAVTPTFLDDVRLVRSAGAVDTRDLASRAVARLPQDAKVWTERYGSLDFARATPYPDFGHHLEVVSCRCVAVVSSYMEDRYRREPKRYASEVRVYDELRRKGRVLQVIDTKPHHLRYDWDLLPEWGMDAIPLRGDVGPVGPTITLIDLR